MSEWLFTETKKKVFEAVEKLTSEGLAENAEPLLPMQSNMLQKYLGAQLAEQKEIQAAELKLKEIRGWMARKEINPKYEKFTDYQVNCGSCAFALWRRMNGDDPEARAVRRNVAPHEEDMELLTGLKFKKTTPEEIEQVLRARGPGSHLILAIARKRGDGHWFNVYYDGKKIWNVDAQNSEISPWPRDYGNVKFWAMMI